MLACIKNLQFSTYSTVYIIPLLDMGIQVHPSGEYGYPMKKYVKNAWQYVLVQICPNIQGKDDRDSNNFTALFPQKLYQAPNSAIWPCDQSNFLY